MRRLLAVTVAALALVAGAAAVYGGTQDEPKNQDVVTLEPPTSAPVPLCRDLTAKELASIPVCKISSEDVLPTLPAAPTVAEEPQATLPTVDQAVPAVTTTLPCADSGAVAVDNGDGTFTVPPLGLCSSP